MELEEQIIAEVLQSDRGVAGGVGFEADEERRLHSARHLHHQTGLRGGQRGRGHTAFLTAGQNSRRSTENTHTAPAEQLILIDGGSW